MAALNLFDVNGSKSRRKMERQGAAAGPLMVGKDSYKIRKPMSSSTSKPVVIYVVPPKVIHAEASEFMALVQRLTGSDSPTSPTAVVVGRDASTSASGKGSDDDGSSVQYGVGPAGISPPTLSLHEWSPMSHHDEDARSSFQFLKGGGAGRRGAVDQTSSSFRPSNPVAVAVAAPCSQYFDVFSRKDKDQEEL